MDLPHAATLCNQCGVVCPVKIPLADLQRKLRDKQTELGMRPWLERLMLNIWAWVALHPMIYRFSSRMMVKFLKIWGGKEKLIHWIPFGAGGGWNFGRDLIAPEGESFMALYQKNQKKGKK